jgi:hypothetical protein
MCSAATLGSADQLHVGRGASKTQMPIVLEAVQNHGVTAMGVTADETRNEGGTPKHLRDRADEEAGQVQVAGRVIVPGHFSQLHDAAVLRQIDRLKRAEVHEGHLLVGSTEPGPTRYTRYS